MEARDSPYIFRDEPDDPVGDAEGRDDDVIIVEGRATTYRDYRSEDA
jgi:hypothetical protein